MSEIISVRFPNGTRNYDFDPGGLRVRIGDEVIVETSQGLEFAICTRGNRVIPDGSEARPLSAVLRLATDMDRQTLAWNRAREREAFFIGEERIAAHGLEMKLIRVSIAFEGNKFIFFFTADGRVDFRALVRDLASLFHSRIELRQIGVRDEARMIGGLGICGRPLCCCQFLTNFLPVSIKMAKTQNLSLNPTKISGACGRLMCCLKYEQFAYEEASRRLPKVESFVQTPDGPGNVKAVDLLRETVRVSLDSDPEHQKTYRCSEVLLLRNGKGSRTGIEIPAPPPRHVEEKPEPSASDWPRKDDRARKDFLRREEPPRREPVRRENGYGDGGYRAERAIRAEETEPRRQPIRNRKQPPEPRREPRKDVRKDAGAWNNGPAPTTERGGGGDGDGKRRQKPWRRNNRKGRPGR